MKLTADDLYKLFQKATSVKWNNEWFEVACAYYKDKVYLFDPDNGEEYAFTYEKIKKDLIEENSSIEFYKLEKFFECPIKTKQTN